MSTWGDLLSFSVPGGQEKLLGYDLPVGDQYQDNFGTLCNCITHVKQIDGPYIF